MHLKNGNWTIETTEPTLMVTPGLRAFYTQVKITDALPIKDGEAFIQANFRVSPDNATPEALVKKDKINYRALYDSALKWFRILQRADVIEDDALDVRILTRANGLNQEAMRVGCTPLIPFVHQIPIDLVFVAVSIHGVHNLEYGLDVELGVPLRLLNIIEQNTMMYRSRFFRVPPGTMWQFSKDK